MYLKGFYEGVMVIGSHKGEKVQNVKKLIQNEMLESNLAILYYEPEKPVISRSGDDCVVALVDQWFLDYGNEQWTAEALECLRKMDMYSDEARHSFEKSLEWLQDWSCSRTYGLGTRLPWDEQYLVESLSDSTIYMAYYTIVHFLQGDIRGSTPGLLNIRADQLNDEIWDYIFLNASLPKKLNGLSVDALDKMKKEFTYWYGFDLRTSGKDLIPNHLSLCIFNHVAIWNNDSSKWPKSFLATGHLMLNSEKMSKSTGNFMTLNDATLRYSADGTRFALADGGDGIEDANFVEATANAAILRLFNWLDWVKDFVDNVDRYENRQLTRSINWNDKVLAHEMQRQIARTQAAYERMMFKEALKSGFFELQQALSRYKEMIGGQENMERNLIMKFIEVQTILLAPLCPHICDYIWLNVLRHETSLMAYHIKRWPQVRDYDNSMIDAADYVCSAVHDFRLKRLAHMNPKTSKKSGASMAPLEKPTHATIWVAKTYPSWQLSILELLNKNLTKLPNGKFLLPENKEISKMLKELSLGKFMKKAMPFVALVKGNLEKSGIGALKTASPFCELTALTSNLEYIRASLDLEGVDVCYSSESEENFIKEETCPSEPKIKFRTDKALKISLINPQCMSGLFSTDLPVYDGDRLAEIERRLIQQNRIIKSRVESRESNLVYYYFDEEASSRKIPVFGENIGKSKVNTNDKLIVSMEKDAILINGISVGCKLVYVLATTD